MKRLAGALFALLLAGGPAVAGDLVAAGKRIYREGVLPSGATLEATVRGDVPIGGHQVACVSCHRRSGLGSSEGGFLVPPIAGPELFQPRGGALHRSYEQRGFTSVNRPAYDLPALATVLRSGVDPAGRTLEPLMPRYDLDDEAVAALGAYLASLTGETAPGVSDTEIHFATLITPGATETQRQGLLAVLETYFAEKDAGTRQEGRRLAHAPFQKSWQYGAYRRWVLHPWVLEGAPASWPAQLERRYAEQPVFALLGGVGGGEWQPVHRFCERHEVPCLFPHTPLPPQAADHDFYSVYLSRGMGLEAGALATYLARRESSQGPVVQVYRDTPAGRLAAARFGEGLSGALHDQRLGADTVADAAFWQALLAREHPGTLVVWLPATDLAGLRETAPGTTELFVSATTVPGFDQLDLGPWGDRLYVVDPYRPLADRLTAPRMKIWARQRGIEITDLPLQADTYYAAIVAGDALSHIRGNFSREYFLERIEHMIDNMPDRSVYPRLSLAPGQRYLAKSCTVWQVAAGPASAVSVTP